MTVSELEALGFYEPGLLHIRINTDFDISDLNKVMAEQPKLFSTFFHEYIHFLQDVTTTVGMTYSNFYISLIKDVNYSVINDGVAEFEIPFAITNDYNTQANIELRKIYMGTNIEERYVRYDRYDMGYEAVTDRDGNTLNVPFYTVYFYDSNRLEKKFNFGITCLKEYVAHTLQQRLNKDVIHPDIPYVIAELLAGKEYPPLVSDLDYLLALCDACLMAFHPAQIFFNTLERMKKQQFVPKTVQEVYDFTYSDLTLRDATGDYTVESLYDTYRNQTLGEFVNALQADYFKSNLEWIRYILDQGRDLRINHRGFMTELVDGQGKLTNLFYSIFEKLGTPFFTNNRSVGGIIPPKRLETVPVQPFQMLVFKQILNLYGGSIKCSLHNFCDNNPEEQLTDHLCLTAPWERGNKPQLCPFGQLWKTWMLNGQIPVPKNSRG